MPHEAAEAGIVDDAIVIKIPLKYLPGIVQYHPDSPPAGEGEFIVTDIKVFAQDLVNEINSEDETGGTLFTRMIDEAKSRAIENGAEGVEEK